MKAYTRRRLIASVKLGLAAVPFFFLLTLLHGRPIVPGTVILGFGIGFAVGVAELFWLRNRLKNTSFLSHLVLKSLAIGACMYAAFAVLNLLDVIIEGIGWGAYWSAITEARLAVGLLEALAVIAFLLFFVQLDRLLGPGVLIGYVTGRYHNPRREPRIFMFLDMKGSTSPAERMHPDRYFSFLHQYFVEMSEAILETDAEIYQYVGDEVVFTWPMRKGVEEANCVRIFFLIDRQIRSQTDHFVREFGTVPDFKAALHAGDVIAAQIGEIESEIVYDGDVLNTAARIQGMCNQLDRRLLVSADLMHRLTLGPEFETESMGVAPLRGKEIGVELFAVHAVDRR